jgi:hypothetical protein
MVSENIYEELKGKVDMTYQEDIKLKGKVKNIKIYSIDANKQS